MNNNVLLMTDVYKMGHMSQYCPGITKVYSYLTARSDRYYNETVFFGLKYYLQEYLTRPITQEHADEFMLYRDLILGTGADNRGVRHKIQSLVDLGYWPVEIKSVEEGKVYPIQNVLMTITNTDPDFYWCVGFLESLLLKVWFPSTVATLSKEYRKIVEQYYEKTCSEEQMGMKDFAVHDFGYRGDSSEESAALAGGAHLLNFMGSDTVVAYPFMDKYYPEMKKTMLSVPASEHSVMCSFGIDNEIDAFRHMLSTYPTGIVSIVSDTYNLWTVLTEHLQSLHSDIVNRQGKVVFRPDSGNPTDIICGNLDADHASSYPEWLGALELLGMQFGYTTNEKGYKELPPYVGLIYGDGMTLECYKETLKRMEQNGWAASNLVIGVGSILRWVTRDTLGFSIKATYVEVNGESRNIFKDPITDSGKRSHKGLLALTKTYNPDTGYGYYHTEQECTWEQEKGGLLKTVFKNGSLF